ncbi:hypothetical protein ACIP4T_06180 [Streptomyces massasporeus]
MWNTISHWEETPPPGGPRLAKIDGTTIGTVTDTNNGSNNQRWKLVKAS